MPAETSEDVSTNEGPVTLDIPGESIEAGEILLIEKASEIFVDNFHLPQLATPLRESHRLCLFSGDQQDKKQNHSSKQANDDQQYFQLLVEVIPEIFNDGTSLQIEGRAKGKSSATLHAKLLRVEIDHEDLQRGQLIFVEQVNGTSMNIVNDPAKVSHHLKENFFTRRDHLQSKGLMQFRIKLDPEFFLRGQILFLKKEDAKSLTEHFAYHRPSRGHLHDLPQTNISLGEFLSSATEWDPVLLNDEHLLRLTLQLSESIDKEEQWKVDFNAQTLVVKTFDANENRFDVFRQVQLPQQAKIDQHKVHWDQHHHSLQLTFPLH